MGRAELRIALRGVPFLEPRESPGIFGLAEGRGWRGHAAVAEASSGRAKEGQRYEEGEMIPWYERKKLLKERGIKEPIRCPCCGERHNGSVRGRACEGQAWYVQDADGRPPGIAVGLWIAYQRDLIVGPLFDMPNKDAWYDRGGWTA